MFLQSGYFQHIFIGSIFSQPANFTIFLQPGYIQNIFIVSIFLQPCYFHSQQIALHSYSLRISAYFHWQHIFIANQPIFKASKLQYIFIARIFSAYFDWQHIFIANLFSQPANCTKFFQPGYFQHIFFGSIFSQPSYFHRHIFSIF